MSNGPGAKKLFLFLSTTALYWLTLYAYVPIVSSYADEMKASVMMVGLIGGAYGFTQMLARIPLGIISDKTGRRKPFMLAGIGFALFAGVIVLLWQSPASLLLARASGGLGAAAWVPFTVLFASYFPPDRAPTAMGIINAVCNGGQLLASLLCGLLVSSFGSAAPFGLTVLSGAAAFLLCFFIVEKAGQARRAPLKLRDLVAVAKNRHTLIVASLGILSQYVTFAAIFCFTPLMAKLSFGATKGELSILTAINTGAALAGAFFCARITRVVPPKKLLVGCYLFSALLYALLPHVPSLPGLYAAQLFLGFSDSCGFTLLLALVLQGVSSDKQATAMGFFQAIYAVGMVLGPIVTGFVREASGGFPIAYLSVSAVGLAAATITGFVLKPASAEAR